MVTDQKVSFGFERTLLNTKSVSFSFSSLVSDELVWFVQIRNQVRQFLHDTREFSLADAEAWFPNNEVQYFVVSCMLENSNFEPIGYFRLKNLGTKGLAEIGMDLDPNFQGRNLGYLAYVEFAKFLKSESDIVGLSLRVKLDNHRAIKLYNRLKFKKIGEFTENELKDMLMFTEVESLASLPT